MKQEKLLDLLTEMTVEEKIGQLVQITGEFFLPEKQAETGPTSDLSISPEQFYQVGSILNLAGSKNVKQVQDTYLANSRLGIPLLFMGDVIHGFKTVFPIPLLQGCSWNPNLVYDCASISAKESTYAGIHVNFSPMVDLVRDSRWGRVLESAGGEDDLLSTVYAKKMIKAYHDNHLACCAKHFIGYGAVEGGRDYNFVDLSRRELLEYYLPPFETCISSGVEMIMTAFTTFEGIPCSVHPWLLKGLLRDTLHFNGILISDYTSILETIAHGYSQNKKDATLKAMKSTVDIDMMSDCYLGNIKSLIEESYLTNQELDQAVLRVLQLKNQLGLFENPYGMVNEQKEKTFILSKPNLEIARKSAAESFVLLENKKQILPLKPETKIALIGPYADNQGISGAWSIYNEKNENTITIKQGILDYLCTDSLLYAKGCPILPEDEFNEILAMEGLGPISSQTQNSIDEIKHACQVANQADVIVLAIGEHYKQSGEGASRSSIEIPKIQLDLLQKLSGLGKPIIAIVFSGRPLVLKEVANQVDGLLWVGFPGTEGGHAICDILYGIENPSGRLTMSFPQSSGQSPTYYNHYSTGRPPVVYSRFTSRYQDIPTTPFYPFGYGLSYSNFEYYNLQLDKTTISSPDDTINVSVTVKNTTPVGGYEVIQLYIQDCYGSVVRPVKQLKVFNKKFFNGCEEKIITFTITYEMLQFYNYNLDLVVEPGEFNVFVGKNAEENLKATFSVK